jgi:hypothetical protein
MSHRIELRRLLLLCYHQPYINVETDSDNDGIVIRHHKVSVWYSHRVLC